MASLALTPRGHLLFTAAEGTLQPPEALSRRLESAFGRGSGHGLLELGAAQVGTALPPGHRHGASGQGSAGTSPSYPDQAADGRRPVQADEADPTDELERARVQRYKTAPATEEHAEGQLTSNRDLTSGL